MGKTQDPPRSATPSLATDAARELDRLIAAQGTKPVADVSEFYDLWPAESDPDDLLRFLAETRGERRAAAAREDPG